jgi:glucokinase
VLLNDYVPVAVALAGLAPGDLVSLGLERPAGAGPKLALGPGTGFGAAALVPVEERWAVVSTEAGHAEFGPLDEAEMALWPLLERVAGRITAETILSGPGLLRLYKAICAGRATTPRCAAPVEVTALAENDEIARAALDVFGRLLGRYAGDLALIFGATGGVYLSSGIAPDILELLRRPGGFRAAFEAKAPHAEWIAKIPTFVVMHRDPALLGLAMLANQPGRFAFAKQSWEAGPGPSG